KKELTSLQKRLEKTIDEFNTFQQRLGEELERVAEKDKTMEDLRSQLKEKTILLEEKEKNLSNMKNQFSESLSKIARLETEVETLRKNLDQEKTLSVELKKKLEQIEKEYSEFKQKEEPIMAQNESIRRLLNATDQGKIYLALVSAYPKSLSIDDLADILGTSAVQIKPILLAMQDLEVVDFTPSTREVKLAD
ncbi:MAG: hypothetical protein ACTSSF_12235, partial [Candidatus Heimdallarchaeaceae archaeon]